MFVGRAIGPAVGARYEGIEFVVEFLENQDKSLVLDALLLAVERFAAANLSQHVVDLGEREGGMLRLTRFTVRIQLFGDGADFEFEAAGAMRERERIEAAGFYINRVVALTEPSAGTQSPRYMDARRKHPQDVRVFYSYGDELVVRQDRRIEKLEDTMLCGFNRRDVAG